MAEALILEHEKQQLLVLSCVSFLSSSSCPSLFRQSCYINKHTHALECEEEQFDVWQQNYSIVCIRWRRLEPTLFSLCPLLCPLSFCIQHPEVYLSHPRDLHMNTSVFKILLHAASAPDVRR